MISSLTARGKLSFGIYLLIVLSTISLSACSSSDETTKSSSAKLEDGKTSLTFSTMENGYPVNWKVFFDDNKITSLYRNGIKIPKNQIHDYEDMVFDELDKINNQRYTDGYADTYEDDFADNNIDIHIDLDNLNENLERTAKELSKHKVKIEFDEEQFDKNMEKLKNELEKLKDLDIEINIDPERLEEDMKDLDKNLQNLRIDNRNFPFDEEKFNKCMKEMTKNMRAELFTSSKRLKVNMENFHNRMNGFRNNMMHFKYNMNDLKANLKKLDLFIKDLKAELVKDKIIDNENDDVEINFSNTGLEINEKRVPDEVFEKCKSLYKKHYGKEIDADWCLKVNE